jgi:hypothetical protein
MEEGVRRERERAAAAAADDKIKISILGSKR